VELYLKGDLAATCKDQQINLVALGGPPEKRLTAGCVSSEGAIR
jgi:hypothetical protein